MATESASPKGAVQVFKGQWPADLLFVVVMFADDVRPFPFALSAPFESAGFARHSCQINRPSRVRFIQVVAGDWPYVDGRPHPANLSHDVQWDKEKRQKRTHCILPPNWGCSYFAGKDDLVSVETLNNFKILLEAAADVGMDDPSLRSCSET
jgi:hypothetical protein